MRGRWKLHEAIAAAGVLVWLFILMRARRQPSPVQIPRGSTTTTTQWEPLPSPVKAPPFGTAVALALVIAIGAGGYWLYQQRTNRIAAAAMIAGGDPTHAPVLLMRYGCSSCHRISGIAASGGLVGPSLTRLGDRIYIAGMLPNTPGNLTEWIADPRAVN